MVAPSPTHLSHFWEDCDALAHENTFLTCDVFCHILPEKRHILAPLVQFFFEREEMWRFGWDWNIFFLPVSDLSIISEALSVDGEPYIVDHKGVLQCSISAKTYPKSLIERNPPGGVSYLLCSLIKNRV